MVFVGLFAWRIGLGGVGWVVFEGGGEGGREGFWWGLSGGRGEEGREGGGKEGGRGRQGGLVQQNGPLSRPAL